MLPMLHHCELFCDMTGARLEDELPMKGDLRSWQTQEAAVPGCNVACQCLKRWHLQVSCDLQARCQAGPWSMFRGFEDVAVPWSLKGECRFGAIW